MDYIKKPLAEWSTECRYPGCNKVGEWRRQRTHYVNDIDNWCCYCEEHHARNDEYWDERWKEYWSGCL